MKHTASKGSTHYEGKLTYTAEEGYNPNGICIGDTKTNVKTHDGYTVRVFALDFMDR